MTDTGPGISSEDQSRIFDKFTQLDRGVTKAHGGTGLGLTIARDLAQMLGGRIEVDSVPGRGATFSVLLPDPPTARERAGARTRWRRSRRKAPCVPPNPNPSPVDRGLEQPHLSSARLR